MRDGKTMYFDIEFKLGFYTKKSSMGDNLEMIFLFIWCEKSAAR